MRTKARLSVFSVLCILSVTVAALTGCEEKRKMLVSAHTAVGELLISTKDQAQALHEQGVINPQTYHNIRINWIRAQTSYIKASDILEAAIDNDLADISAYAELIAQANTILSDIALWLSEPQHLPTPTPTQGAQNEPANNRTLSHPALAANHPPRSGNPADTGIERIGPGGAQKVGGRNEGKSVPGDVERLKVVSSDVFSYKAGDAVSLSELVTDKTRSIHLLVSQGAIKYAMEDQSVSVVSMPDGLVLSARSALLFPGRAIVDGTKLSISVLE